MSKFIKTFWVAFSVGVSTVAFADDNIVDCHTSDVPGGVTITADDGSQLVRPSILPTLPDISLASHEKPLDDSPCSGPVGDPILQRESAELPWEHVVEKTSGLCPAMDFVDIECKPKKRGD